MLEPPGWSAVPEARERAHGVRAGKAGRSTRRDSELRGFRPQRQADGGPGRERSVDPVLEVNCDFDNVFFHHGVALVLVRDFSEFAARYLPCSCAVSYVVSHILPAASMPMCISVRASSPSLRRPRNSAHARANKQPPACRHAPTQESDSRLIPLCHSPQKVQLNCKHVVHILWQRLRLARLRARQGPRHRGRCKCGCRLRPLHFRRLHFV